MLVYLTTYCPFQAGLSAAQRQIEGGPRDRRGKPLHTLEDHIADPVAHPHGSLAGDYRVFPYGTQLDMSDTVGWPSAEWQARSGSPIYILRVVDTGGHFFGPEKTPAESEAYDLTNGKAAPRKVIRAPGYEPIDVCVAACGGSSLLGGDGRQEASIVDGNGAISSVLSSLGGLPISADYVAPSLVALGAVGLLYLVGDA